MIDLFRDWDDDGNGKVDKKEFRKAMKALGLDVPRKEVDGLFDSFDPDGGGSIEYNELNKALKRKVALDPSMQAGAVPIELKVRQPSPDSSVRVGVGVPVRTHPNPDPTQAMNKSSKKLP